jgi:protein phosphatase
VQRPAATSRATGLAPTQAAAKPPARVLPGQPALLIDCGGFSGVGRVRERNEDRFLIQQWIWNDDKATHQATLLVVADGMGGYQGGDLAASLAVRTLATQLAGLYDRALAGMSPGDDVIAEAIDKALREANRIVYQQSQAEPRYKGMGATAAVALIWDNRVCFGHVGDCRVYLHRRGKLQQLTEDQTLVNRMVALGKLTPEEAAVHPQRNEVLQALGPRTAIEPSRATQALECGDRLLMSCDGLTTDVAPEAIQKVMNRDTLSAGQVATTLVAAADEGGGNDNCTVLVAQVLAGV